VKGLSLVSFFNDISSEMVYPILPAFLTGALGAGPALLGVLDGASELASAIIKWISGRLSDRPGWRKPLVLGGYATAVLVRPLMSFANSAMQVIGFRVIDRVGKGLRTAPRDAMLAEFTPRGMEGRAFGFHRGADHLGAVLGALMAWWAVAEGMEVREVIEWSAVPGLLAVVVLVFVLRGRGRIAAEDGKGEVEARIGAAGGSLLGHHFSQVLLAPILLLAFLALWRIPEALLLFRLQQLGVPVATIPLLWAGLHVVRSAASYPAGMLNDKLGPSALIGIGAAIFAFCMLLLGKPLPVGWAVAVFLFFGLVAAATESSERTIVARLSPAMLGRGFGVYHALTGLAALPTGLMFGLVYQKSGASDALWLSGAGVGMVGIFWIATQTSRR
jgi:MFS family permease